MVREKTYEEINEKIRSGSVVVVTAEEVIAMVEDEGFSKTAETVDVVTTGTFGPMCSSGAFLSIGHTKPRIKISDITLNGVPAYGGLAAVDIYLGATAIPDFDPANNKHPGDFNYGGAHVIEDLVAGREIKYEAAGYGTDCYPREKAESVFRLEDINEAFLFNPRNSYQNYNVGINLSDGTLYTYMGILKPRMGNANYSSAGQLSPLFNDPYMMTIGMGTSIFLGGGIGYVSWHGTQHNPCVAREENGTPKVPGATLSLIGDLKQMNSRWLRGLSYMGYGVTLQVGVGIPIPVLNEEILRFASVKDSELFAPVVDYSTTFPMREAGNMGWVSYEELKSGRIIVQGKEVATAPLSSYPGAREIAETLKSWIKNGSFLLTRPATMLPGHDSGVVVKTRD